jgi:hypothetical protein
MTLSPKVVAVKAAKDTGSEKSVVVLAISYWAFALKFKPSAKTITAKSKKRFIVSSLP